jgi:uncharacterized repeat protein (TIGR03803 family)
MRACADASGIENVKVKLVGKSFNSVVNLFRRFFQVVPVYLVLLLASPSFGAVTFKAVSSFKGANGAQPLGQLLRSTNGLFYGTTASGGVNGQGVIYSATTGGVINPVASFDGTNGAQPLVGLVQGLDGRFFGTASSGGLYGQGTIFVATADGTLTNLFSFDGTNGTRPLAPLTLGGDGNFYGTASAGGVFNFGTLFMVTPTGDFTLLYSFTGTSGSQPAGALLWTGTNFMGTAASGGLNGYGTIFRFDALGFVNLYFFTGRTDGAGPQSGLTLAADGFFYGTTASGGTNFPGQGNGVLFAVDSVGNFSKRHSFTGLDGASPMGTLLQGASGILYGTTASGGTRNAGTIYTANVNGAFSNLYSFSGRLDGSGPSSGLTGGTNGNLFGVTPGGGQNGLGSLFQLSGFTPFIIQSPLTPLTVVSGDTVVLTVIAGGTAPLSFQWQFNSNNIVNGENIRGATSPSLTLSNITTMQAGTYFVTVRNSAGQAASASAQVSVIPRPLISITAPQRGAQTHSAAFRVTGTTSGEAAVARVYFRLNDGDWQLGATSDSWMHWRADITMPSGPNRVDAFAESVLGTFSKTNSVAFACMVTSAPVVVRINGAGIVNPNLNGEYLQVGKSYSITAIPAVGSVFANWSGGVETNAPKIVFVMETNLVLQANFEPDKFYTGKGTYNGLFQAIVDVSPTNSGLFALTLNGRGAFSGYVQLGVMRNALAGRFDTDGNAEVIVARRNLNAVTIDLHLVSTEFASVIHGTVSDGVWIAPLFAYRAIFNAITNPAPYAGRYTLVIPGQPGSTNVPAGDSYGTVTINLAGQIRFSGSLSDNTKISQGMIISKDGYWPFYIPLYGSHGLTSGMLWIGSTNSAPAAITGNVTWYKPEVPTAKYYPAGFRFSSDVIGPRYVMPASGVPILDPGTNATVTFSGGDLEADIINSIALDAKSRVTNNGGNPMSLIFSLTNGVFQGSVTDTNSSQQFPFRGVVLQNENNAAGYFLGPTQSGEVLISQ